MPTPSNTTTSYLLSSDDDDSSSDFGIVNVPKIVPTSSESALPPGRYPTYLHAPVSLSPIAKTEPSPAGPRIPNRMLNEKIEEKIWINVWKIDNDDETYISYRISSGGVNLLFLVPEIISGGYPTERKTCNRKREC